MPGTIDIDANHLRLTLDPGTGGAIARLEYQGIPLLRPVSDPRLAAQHGRAVAAYPLLPYANRIAGGRFTWAGETHQLDLNFGDHPNSIHGNAWMRSWSVENWGTDHAKLSLTHTPPNDPVTEWPFRYRATMDFHVTDTTVDIHMALENTDTKPWPAGLGLHPYIARAPSTTLQFDADTVWRNGPDGLPLERIAVVSPWDFTSGKPLDDTLIDECYAGWSGGATIAWPDSGMSLRLEADLPLDHLQLYTPPGRDFFGLEPVSNMPNAINRMADTADEGLRVLAPGETLAAFVRFVIMP
jgi:aldose 1-epimerase